jgi:hypothetical protein
VLVAARLWGVNQSAQGRPSHFRCPCDPGQERLARAPSGDWLNGKVSRAAGAPAPQLKKKFIPTVTRKFAEVASSGTSTLAYI